MTLVKRISIGNMAFSRNNLVRCLLHPAGDVLWVFVEPGNVVP